jgi:hypothetical protein
MRYLKYFESNVHPIQKNYKNFVIITAYLIDTGFKVEISEYYMITMGCMRHALKISYKGYFLVGILGSNKR